MTAASVAVAATKEQDPADPVPDLINYLHRRLGTVTDPHLYIIRAFREVGWRV
jgi:hypothetical protein